MKDELTYSISWSFEDHCYIGRVAEFESISSHGDTPEEALQEIRSAINFANQISKEDRAKRILDIGKKMNDFSKDFVFDVMKLAIEFEGVYDLMVLWEEDENDQKERFLIIEDLRKIIEERSEKCML